MFRCNSRPTRVLDCVRNTSDPPFISLRFSAASSWLIVIDRSKWRASDEKLASKSTLLRVRRFLNLELCPYRLESSLDLLYLCGHLSLNLRTYDVSARSLTRSLKFHSSHVAYDIIILLLQLNITTVLAPPATAYIYDILSRRMSVRIQATSHSFKYLHLTQVDCWVLDLIFTH